MHATAPTIPTFPTHPTPTSPTATPLSPLLEALLRAASPQDIPTIRAEALHVLGSLSKNYFDILWYFLLRFCCLLFFNFFVILFIYELYILFVIYF